MTELDLEEIEMLANAAQPSPWKSYIEGRDHDSGSDFIMVGVGENRLDDIELSGATRTDQDFIASARQAVPALIAEIKRLKICLDKYEK